MKCPVCEVGSLKKISEEPFNKFFLRKTEHYQCSNFPSNCAVESLTIVTQEAVQDG